MGLRRAVCICGLTSDSHVTPHSHDPRLECELVDRRSFKTKTKACLVVFTWIEGWYNPRRRHSALGDRSPMNFEQQQQKENPTTTTIEYDPNA